MSKTTYPVPKGLNRPVEIKGLKGECIGYAATTGIVLLFAYAFLYLLKVPTLIRLPVTGIAAALLAYRITRLNQHYTPHGLMKRLSSKRIPRFIRSDTRNIFRQPPPK